MHRISKKVGPSKTPQELIFEIDCQPVTIANIQKDIQPSHAGESALIAALPQVLARLGAFKPWEWKETQELLANIIRGQSGDLGTFTDPATVTALADADALEDYIYLVAGCVGEWWTRMGFHHYPKYADKTEAELLPLAGSFGKALQLVNILRGEMSIVGPRPALPTQTELIALRIEQGTFEVRPGLTGLAQVSSYDGMPATEKAMRDADYARAISLMNDLKIIWRTFGYLRRPPPVY